MARATKDVKGFEVHLERLAGYFPSFERGVPVASEQLEALGEFYPTLGDELRDVYMIFDGFDCHLQDRQEGQWMTASQHLELIAHARSGENPLFTVLFPVRSLPCFTFDCVVQTGRSGHGSVVFWDPDHGPEPDRPIAGTIESYLDFLAESLIERYQPNGRIKAEYDWASCDDPNSKTWPWPHEQEWTCKRDEELAALMRDEEYGSLFGENLDWQDSKLSLWSRLSGLFRG